MRWYEDFPCVQPTCDGVQNHCGMARAEVSTHCQQYIYLWPVRVLMGNTRSLGATIVIRKSFGAKGEKLEYWVTGVQDPFDVIT